MSLSSKITNILYKFTNPESGILLPYLRITTLSSAFGGSVGGTVGAFNYIKHDNSLANTILARATLCPVAGILGGITGFLSGPFLPFIASASAIEHILTKNKTP